MTNNPHKWHVFSRVIYLDNMEKREVDHEEMNVYSCCIISDNRN